MHLKTSLSPPVKHFYRPFQCGASFVDHLCYFCLVLLCFHARLFVDALWSPAGKGLTSWLSFVMSNCDVVTFLLVFWVRCGAWLYRFLTFAPFLTLSLLNSDHQYWRRFWSIHNRNKTCPVLTKVYDRSKKCLAFSHYNHFYLRVSILTIGSEG